VSRRAGSSQFQNVRPEIESNAGPPETAGLLRFGRRQAMLEGRQVRLRAVELDDLERYYAWMNDREVTRYLAADYPLSREDERRWLESAPANGFANGVRLAIETKDGVHIGTVALHDVRGEDRRATLGVMIGDKQYWSNGYGSDAIVTLLRFAYDEMNLHRVQLHVFEFNERGIACYRKCGFVEEGRLRDHRYQEGRYWDVIVMGVLRDEFESLHGVEAARAAESVS
jgi:RimJ/RimL family protein N-acetyltransferase